MKKEKAPLRVINYRKNGEIMDSTTTIPVNLTKILIEKVGLDVLASHAGATQAKEAISQ